MNRKRSGLLVSFFAGVLLLLGSSTANAADMSCSTGTYNIRMVATGACAWGHTSTGTSALGYYADVDMSVVDAADDGVCARADYRVGSWFLGIWSWSKGTLGEACGYNTSAAAQVHGIYYTSGAGAVQVRVCASGLSCTPWKTIAGSV